MPEISIKQLNREETAPALELVWRVFREYEAPDYTQQGVDEFYKTINDEKYVSALSMWGAFLDRELVGVIAARNGGRHIALFFVDGRHHRQGIGRKLFETMRTEKMTVNSSPYAVPVYTALGFRATAPEQVVNGLRFTPMELQ